MKKVGIIGGGIAGLTCGYRLVQKGVNSIIFEKEIIIGGRTNYAVAIGSEKFQTYVMKLVKELDLEEAKVILKKNEIAFFLKDLMPVEKLPQLALKSLGARGTLSFLRFSRFVNSLNFNAFFPSKELLDLRNISLAQYGEKFSEKVRFLALAPAIVFSGKDDLNSVGADYGLCLIRMGNELTSGKAIGFEEVNLMSLSNILAKEIREKGGEILSNCEVKRVIKKEEGFEICYEKLGEEKVEIVEKVVFALPLFHVPKIFPELEIKTNIEYPLMKILIIKGKPKYPRRLIIGLPGNSYNFRVWMNLIPTEQYFIPWEKEKKVSLDFLYEDYQVISEKEIAPIPSFPPNPQVPELKTSIEGVFLAGDFYYYPFDTSVQTAEVIAKMISKDLK